MLQWEWPKTWSAESKEVIRDTIEKAVGKAMAGGKNAQIRGVVSVDELNMGCIPPEITLSGIRVLSAEHTAIMVKVRYNGDFSVRLRGLEINLDTVGASAEEADANFALPFFCPFEMTLQDICLDGMISIEVFQEIEENPQWEHGSNVAVHNAVMTPGGGKSSTLRPSRPLRSLSSRGRGGYGVLLGGGGRRAMRPPGVLDNIEGSLSTLETDSYGRGTSKSFPLPRGSAPSFADILLKKVVVRRRMVKVQFFGDPLKHFRVISNFSSVPGANSKVEGMILMLIKPAIEGLMEEGVVFAI